MWFCLTYLTLCLDGACFSSSNMLLFIFMEYKQTHKNRPSFNPNVIENTKGENILVEILSPVFSPQNMKVFSFEQCLIYTIEMIFLIW